MGRVGHWAELTSFRIINPIYCIGDFIIGWVGATLTRKQYTLSIMTSQGLIPVRNAGLSGHRPTPGIITQFKMATIEIFRWIIKPCDVIMHKAIDCRKFLTLSQVTSSKISLLCESLNFHLQEKFRFPNLSKSICTKLALEIFRSICFELWVVESNWFIRIVTIQKKSSEIFQRGSI